MKRLIILSIFAILTFQYSTAKKIFVEMEFHKNSIILDDGTNKKRQPIKDENGKELKFISLIGAMNYMSLQGWDFIDTKSITNGGYYAGTGGSETKIYYIFSRNVCNDELEEAVNNSYKE